MIIIVAVKMSIVLYQLELPWILIPRKLKYKEARKVGYYSSVHQNILFPKVGRRNEEQAVMSQGSREGRMAVETAMIRSTRWRISMV